MNSPTEPPHEPFADNGAEAAAMAERYARRLHLVDRYSLLRPDVWQTVQERQRAILQLLVREDLDDPSTLRIVEVGCGTGGNLLEWLRMGATPGNLCGIELLAPRLAIARGLLPAGVTLVEGDASRQPIASESVDIVCQSTVFSSILDDSAQQRLAHAMWRWVRPGGGVLWYDFTMDNPRNPDVRGVPMATVRRLFPLARISARRVTLAPPIARAVCRVHPALYGALNLVPLLRTHVLAWIAKPFE